VVTLFERLARSRPAQTEERKRPLTELEQAQRLLDWLQVWNKPSVSTKDIRCFGPGCLRDKERALKSAQILERFGWLTPSNPHQRKVRRWEIARRPIIQPALADSSKVAAMSRC
jgi:hypothetical protein